MPTESQRYPRTDFWGDDADADHLATAGWDGTLAAPTVGDTLSAGADDLPSIADLLDRNDDEYPGTSHAEYVAHEILRHGADRLCPPCLRERDCRVVLPDPTEYVHKQRERSHGFDRFHVRRYRRRVCPECGELIFGGILADRPREAFREIVAEVLAAIDGLPESRREKLFSDAMARKGRGQLTDEQIMKRLVRDLTAPSDTDT